MNTPPTEDEIKKHVTHIFNTVATGYDNPSTRFFTFCADKMLGILQPEPDTRLLDIATGTGAVAIAAAPLLKPAGHVHGIDLSEKMLERAFENITKQALTNIDLHTMDAVKPVFEADYFHYITCSFGLFFLPDMAQALQNWRQLLQPGGKIIFSSFGPAAFTPLSQLFKDRLAQYDVIVPDASWFRLSDTRDCERLLTETGYTDVKTTTKQLGYHLLRVDDWWEICWNTGFRGFLNQLSAADLSSFKKEHLAEVQALATDDGIWLDIETIFSEARKAQ